MIESSEESTFILPTTFGKCLGENLNSEHKGKQIPSRPPCNDPRSKDLIDYVCQNIPLTGTIKMDSRGYIYLKLSDSYIIDIYSYLNQKQIDMPPYFDQQKPFGAHISVVLPQEERQRIVPEEIDCDIEFEITGSYFAEPENWYEMKYVWFLTIKSPSLESLRTKLGLSSKINDEEFYITFAVQKRFLTLTDVLAQTKNNAITLGTGEVTQSKIRSLKNANRKA